MRSNRHKHETAECASLEAPERWAGIASNNKVLVLLSLAVR